ncbi:hypothetical protein KM885_11690 [Oceanobacillus caeni]|uniref:YkvI family membrane protein n=1 Tax=Oceanobacillus caeni TaxID=405946 RepID=UPI001C24238B|nr:hypothetical protein [Oceanobacillus caeni]MBU8791448.1 hypothetical protein [Oceanobacillus caeni]
MREILKLASAFIGIIVGAGFASGQEILQYYTSFGLLGIIGGIIATALFAFLGMVLMLIGSKTKTSSHKDAIYAISGPYLGVLVDIILILTLFGVGVVMVAGAGSNLNQQFGLPYFVGTTLMAILILTTGMLKINKVVSVIGSITPFLVLFIIIISIYSFFTLDTSFANLDPIAREVYTPLPNWIISTINYVSFNIALGASMTLVMGGAEKNIKTATLGGLVGGLGLGALIILSNLAIFSKIETVAADDMPMLSIVNSISPILGSIMSVILFGMIFNTAISMFFSLTARFAKVGTRRFKVLLTIFLILGYILSFIGFTDLVSQFYPLIGYLGLVLIGTLIVTFFRMQFRKRSHE